MSSLKNKISLGVSLVLIVIWFFAMKILAVPKTDEIEYVKLVHRQPVIEVAVKEESKPINLPKAGDAKIDVETERIIDVAKIEEAVRAKELEKQVCAVEKDSKAVYNVPNCGKAKPWNITYMSYKKVTSKSSMQYRLLYSEDCYTDPETGIRMVDDKYCIAIGTGYNAPVGTVVYLITDDSCVPCVVGDIKAPNDTDSSNMYCKHDGSVVEFVVDKKVFTDSSMYPEEFENTVRKLIVSGDNLV